MSMDRAELQDAARKAFGANGLVPDAEASWGLIADMGWLMMAVPEALGGLGLGGEAAAVIHSELGRALVPGPAIAQMLAIEALAAAGVAERDDLLGRAMGGEMMTASLAGDASEGRLSCVPDADRASHVLVVGEARVALVALDAPGVTIGARDTWDTTRRLFDVDLGSASGLVLAEGLAAAALGTRLHAQLLMALAADSLGGAEANLELTVDYLKTRRQFDRPLALFQALKHRVADLRVRLSAALALMWSLALGSSSDPAESLAAMGALKAHATTVARDVAEEAIQLHGGIGLTMEHHCHLFLKRALLNCALGGDAERWDEQTGRLALAAA